MNSCFNACCDSPRWTFFMYHTYSLFKRKAVKFHGVSSIMINMTSKEQANSLSQHNVAGTRGSCSYTHKEVTTSYADILISYDHTKNHTFMCKHMIILCIKYMNIKKNTHNCVLNIMSTLLSSILYMCDIQDRWNPSPLNTQCKQQWNS